MSQIAQKSELSQFDSENRIEKVQKFLFIAPTIVYLLLLSIFPFVYSVYLSLHDVKLTSAGRKFFVGFENYANLFKDEIFIQSIKNTTVLILGSLAIELTLGFLLARLFYSLAGLILVNFFRSMVILPMMTTPICIAMLALYVLDPTLGIVSYLLSLLGIEPITWFASSSTALLSVILINAWQWTPFMMLLMLAGLMSIPRNLYEAADIEGAKWHHLVRWIELPAIRDIIIIGVILRVIENLKLFDLVYITTRGGPGDATEILTFFAYRTNFTAFRIGYGSAAAVMILVISIIVTTIAVLYMRKLQHEVSVQ